MRELSLLGILIFLLNTCNNYEYDKEPDTSIMVVEGWIEDGGFPVVMLTRPLFLSDDWQYIDSLSDYIIRWAKVTISDGTDSVVLTGKYDKGYFPPYIYTTGWMKGEAGKTYVLTAEYRDLRASAVTTIPSSPDNCSFKVERCADSDTLYQIKLHFTDNPVQKDYYQVFTRVGGKAKQYLVSYLGSIDDAVLEKETDVFAYRGHQKLLNYDYNPYFMLDDTVSIKFAQVDSVSFRIFDDYTKMLSLSDNMFLSTSTNIESNIVGGYGYWCGYNAITRHIVIRDSVESGR